MPRHNNLPTDITINIIFGILASVLAVGSILATVKYGSRIFHRSQVGGCFDSLTLMSPA
jgi:hypothetical protein